MRLENGNITLRPLIIKDALVSVNWRNNPKIWELTVNSPTKYITIDDELTWITNVIQERNSFRFAILFEDIYIGNIQLTNIKDKESYYGIFIGETYYWGRGIGLVATYLILKFAFIKINLNKVKLRVRIKNIVAYKLYLNIGFCEINRDLELIYMEITKNQYLDNERVNR